MKKYLVIIFLTTLIIQPGFCQADVAGKSIDRLMQSRIGSRNSGTILFNSDEFNIPQVGRSNNINNKSKFKAALYSLVLPGAGQYYIGSSKAKWFFGFESGCWITYYGFRKYGAFKKDAARGWAVLKAGAYSDNSDERYWIKMTFYDNRDINEGEYEFGYNQMAPVFERDNVQLFPETPEYYWNWDNSEDRQRYRYLRNQSKTAYQRSDIVIGLVIANHIVSAVEAYLSAIKYNRRLEFSDAGFKFNYRIDSNIHNPGITLLLSKNF